MTVKWQGSRGPQEGQSMVEFLITLVFLVVPMLLGLNYVMRLGEAEHKSYEAARYAVWERTVWHQSDNNYNVKADQAISRELNRRIFGEQQRSLSSTEDQVPLAGNRDLALDPVLYDWESGGGSRAGIIQRSNGQGGNYNSLALPEEENPATFSSFITDAMGRYLGLEHRGFYNARVEVALHKNRRLRPVFDALLGPGGTLSAQADNAMLVGAWNADGPDDVRRVVRRGLPTSLLDNSVMDLVTGAVGLAFPEIGDLDFGHIDPERVPCQRLTQVQGNQGVGC